MQELKFYQSLWAMELRNPRVPERSMAENFRMIAEAGFDGVSIDPAAHEIDDFLTLRQYYEAYGLSCMVNAFPDTEDDLLPLLRLACEFDATVVNVISGVMPMDPRQAVPVVRRWMDEAASMDMKLLFETHRDGLLNDLYFTLQLMKLVPELRLCADLSHFVVDRELRTPVPVRDQALITSVLERSDGLQGRIATREQIQVPIDFEQHRVWVDIFLGWWKEGMRMWRERNGADAALTFLCELGPPPYAITDANQQELSDRWQEALQIRSWVADLWQELQAAGRPPGG